MLTQRRFYFPELFLGVLLAVAIFAMGAAFWSSQARPSEQNSRAKTETSVDQQKQKESWADPLPVITLLLVIVGTAQLVLFYRQLNLIRRSLAPAEQAAKAASSNAKALISAERARFHVVIHTHNLDKFIMAATFYPNSGGMPTSGDVEIYYYFKNYGKAPGLILEMSQDIALSESPPDPVYQVIRQVPREYMIASGQESEHQICRRELAILSVADALEVDRGRKTIWFCGRFDYRDFVTDEPQVHRFYLRYVRAENGIWRFQSIDHKHYNQST